MSFAYTVTLNDPTRSSLGSALVANVSAAVAQWARHLYGRGSLDVRVNVTPTTRANAGAATVVPIGTDGARTVYQNGTAYELLTGTDPNGSGADLVVNVDPTYLQSLWLDASRTAPSDRTDGLSVFMHEIGHGLGIQGYRDLDTGALPAAYETTWDRLVGVNADGAAFTGRFARAVFGESVTVTTLQNGQQYNHLGNAASERIGQDLMNGVVFYTGTRYAISDVDLGIMKDLGLAVTSGADGNALMDPFFYTTTYGDVSRARVNAGQHYAQSGWREGRDPSAFFSTSGYRAANGDVRAAGINPLDHYAQSGWREGRDPSAAFDNELYLARNADVRAAGINPLQHYLESGRFEGRASYAAVGRAGDIGAHNGFDAQYYLLDNPDVAAAALITGGDGFAFAYDHYRTNGWREGRDPNAVFDTRGYLNAYADVRAAGLDPLEHYDRYGWREGRDPSAGFDSSAYLAAYADVRAANLDPLVHYLQNGRLEGRSAFADGSFGRGATG